MAADKYHAAYIMYGFWRVMQALMHITFLAIMFSVMLRDYWNFGDGVSIASIAYCVY